MNQIAERNNQIREWIAKEGRHLHFDSKADLEERLGESVSNKAWALWGDLRASLKRKEKISLNNKVPDGFDWREFEKQLNN